MFRRMTTKRSAARDLGVQFRDGHGVTTQAGRSAQRLEAVRASATVMRG